MFCLDTNEYSREFSTDDDGIEMKNIAKNSKWYAIGKKHFLVYCSPYLHKEELLF